MRSGPSFAPSLSAPDQRNRAADMMLLCAQRHSLADRSRVGGSVGELIVPSGELFPALVALE
jgi:hypothetical protein